MPEPSIIAPGAIEPNEVEVFEGVVATDAAVIGEEVFVTIEDFDDDESSWRHGPCKWNPVIKPTGFFYPKREDLCTVVIPSTGIPAIVVFTPKAAEPDTPLGDSLLAAEGLGLIFHEEDENAPRPPGFKYRWWFGPKNPLNAEINDLWTKGS